MLNRDLSSAHIRSSARRKSSECPSSPNVCASTNGSGARDRDRGVRGGRGGEVTSRVRPRPVGRPAERSAVASASRRWTAFDLAHQRRQRGGLPASGRAQQQQGVGVPDAVAVLVKPVHQVVSPNGVRGVPLHGHHVQIPFELRRATTRARSPEPSTGRDAADHPGRSRPPWPTRRRAGASPPPRRGPPSRLGAPRMTRPPGRDATLLSDKRARDDARREIHGSRPPSEFFFHLLIPATTTTVPQT